VEARPEGYSTTVHVEGLVPCCSALKLGLHARLQSRRRIGSQAFELYHEGLVDPGDRIGDEEGLLHGELHQEVRLEPKGAGYFVEDVLEREVGDVAVHHSIYPVVA
jgi:hypothetical protein